MFYVFAVTLVVAALIVGIMGKFPPPSFSERKRYTVAVAAFALGMACVILLIKFNLRS
ncbi:MAG: hypothetical protein JWO67_3556 [Streptosporangiaceae bacterium]|nr:hypothetical protein [Streptosporangiaceae bacterium]